MPEMRRDDREGAPVDSMPTSWTLQDDEAMTAARIAELEAILDDLCDWAQHVAAPEDDAIHSIVERAEEALKNV